MAPRYDIREVQDRGHYWQAVYDVTLDDGSVTQHGHSIPKETLEWRAAEYGFDPETELNAILDVVLAEPFIADEDRVSGELLHDAPDIATARARHVNRCAKAKLKHRMSTRKKTAAAAKAGGKAADPEVEPLDVIRNGCVMDKTVIAVKAEHVRRARAGYAEQARSTPEQREARRAERVAQELSVDLDGVTKRMKGKNNG